MSGCHQCGSTAIKHNGGCPANTNGIDYDAFMALRMARQHLLRPDVFSADNTDHIVRIIDTVLKKATNP